VVGNPINTSNGDYFVRICDFNYQNSGAGDCRTITLPSVPTADLSYFVVRPLGGS